MLSFIQNKKALLGIIALITFIVVVGIALLFNVNRFKPKADTALGCFTKSILKGKLLENGVAVSGAIIQLGAVTAETNKYGEYILYPLSLGQYTLSFKTRLGEPRYEVNGLKTYQITSIGLANKDFALTKTASLPPDQGTGTIPTTINCVATLKNTSMGTLQTPLSLSAMASPAINYERYEIESTCPLKMVNAYAPNIKVDVDLIDSTGKVLTSTIGNRIFDMSDALKVGCTINSTAQKNGCATYESTNGFNQTVEKYIYKGIWKVPFWRGDAPSGLYRLKFLGLQFENGMAVPDSNFSYKKFVFRRERE